MSRITSFLGRHKKALIVLAVLAVAGTVGWMRMNQAAAAAQKAAAQQVQTFTLEKGDLSRTLSGSGSIQSAQVTQVAAAQTYPVAEVLVSEGFTREVTDSPAYDESVPDKLVCTLCGEEKPATAE